VELGASLPINLESSDLRLVQVDFGRQNHQIGKTFQKGVGEASAKASTVYVVSSTFWDIDLFTTGTKNLKSGSSWDVTDTYRENLLLIT
jgi:hypothetical protein